MQKNSHIDILKKSVIIKYRKRILHRELFYEL